MTQITILNQANTPMGPFTRQQVADKLQRGEITLASLAHAEGFQQWTPLRDVLARVDLATLPVAMPPGMPPAPVSMPPAAAPAYSYAVTMAPPVGLRYAGFWERFVALILDGLILTAACILLEVVFVVIGLIFGGVSGAFASNSGSQSGDNSAAGVGLGLMVVFLYIVFIIVAIGGQWLYFAKLESGPTQATIGKRVMGIKVTDMTGQRISFGRATGRFFGKLISGMTFYIGYIMAAFTDRKQTLHDLIASTLVVKG
jgi:uncharacterized RDD family membrane protein YckC